MQSKPATYAVIASMAAAAIAALINLQSGLIFDALIAIAYGAGVYWAVYAKLSSDPDAATTGAAVLSGIAVILFFVAFALHDPVFSAINLVAAVCLGYAFAVLKNERKQSSSLDRSS